MSDESSKDPKAQQGRGREPRLRDIARRFMRELDERDPRREEHPDETELSAADSAEDQVDAQAAAEGRADAAEEAEGQSEGERRRMRAEVRELLGQVLATGNKTRAELIRLVAREVRFYLEAAELDVLLHDLVTNYSLEVNASIHLKPLDEDAGPPTAKVGLRKKGATADDGGAQG